MIFLELLRDKLMFNTHWQHSSMPQSILLIQLQNIRVSKNTKLVGCITHSNQYRLKIVIKLCTIEYFISKKISAFYLSVPSQILTKKIGLNTSITYILNLSVDCIFLAIESMFIYKDAAPHNEGPRTPYKLTNENSCHIKECRMCYWLHFE